MNPSIRIFLSLLPVNLVSHDVVEVISSHKSIIVQISLGENVLDFIVSQFLSQILGNLLQFKSCKSSSSVDIKSLENFVYFNSAFFVTELSSCKSQELREVDTSGLIVIEFGKDLIYEFVLSSKSKAFKGSL